ncbi:hypothetical protein Patl1_17031 [Pistacia atlantica]|uniref:Uncharacterized protein n=1 Tax=Pistacia atlantica TaxID=434234 RepID=A0ACC1B933_9ROSI|nr:hypothetical protein Patl1_17031 [Pistacia atlantica]
MPPSAACFQEEHCRGRLPVIDYKYSSVWFMFMKFTCLSKGGGNHFPPCHILDVCGFRVLLECPLDLSALAIFAPFLNDRHSIVPEETSDYATHKSLDAEYVAQKRQKVEKPLDANDLIHAEPWYKTVNNLHLWNVSFIDVVLISSPMGMVGLPFLTRMKGFSAKIYVTEATARLGQLMMEDLVSMHMEYKQYYGSEGSSDPQWMKWQEIELLPSSLRKIACGEDGAELGGWMPLYSAADVKDCLTKVQTVRYTEEACYNGALIIKAFSSGSEIGACNWIMNGPKGNIAYVSGSIFASDHAMNFDYSALQGRDLILYSDFFSLDTTEEMDESAFSDDNDKWEALTKSLRRGDENLEEREKLAFICSCAIDSVKAGGSVLIPINGLGVVLQFLEQISMFLESSSLQVPIYIISSVAEELLAYTSIIPEWLCDKRQEKLFSGEPLFAHVELLKAKKIQVFPAVYSPKLLTNWQEPCIVFSPHWSLRLGPAMHLLRRWCGDQNSLLVLEDKVDANIALLPFKPMSMKVLQCSFIPGIKLQKVQLMLEALQPKFVLFPEELRSHFNTSNVNSFSVSHYSENETVCIPSLKESVEVEIEANLGSQFQWRISKHKNLNITRLKGELLVAHNKHQLLSRKELAGSSKSMPLLHWGSPDPENLLAALSKMGINGNLERSMSDAESGEAFIVHIKNPKRATIEVGAAGTVISADDENLASQVFEALGSILDGI